MRSLTAQWLDDDFNGATVGTPDEQTAKTARKEGNDSSLENPD